MDAQELSLKTIVMGTLMLVSVVASLWGAFINTGKEGHSKRNRIVTFALALFGDACLIASFVLAGVPVYAYLINVFLLVLSVRGYINTKNRTD